MIRKAMVLAAGLGQRLRPLTDRIPKPLIEIQGQSLIERMIYALKASGVQEIAVNLHHLGARIQAHLGDGVRFGLSIRYFWENELLGTGGALLNARAFLEDDVFYVVNSDILTDLPFPTVEAFHRSSGGIATMVCLHQTLTPDPEEVVVSDGRVLAVRNVPSLRPMLPSKRFTGVQILTPDVFAFLPPGPSSIIHAFYQPALLAGRTISAFLYDGLWEDIGTPETYERLTGQRPS